MTNLRKAVRILTRGRIEPVYLLQGDDYYLQDFFVQQVSQAIRQLVGQAVAKTVLLPDEMGGREIIQRLQGRDLFGTAEVFILRNPAALKPPYRAELLDYCHNPVEAHYLVIVVDEFGDRSPVVKSLKGLLPPIAVQTPFESEMRKWADYLFKHQGLDKVPPEVLDAALELAGDSVYHLSNEITKIALLVGEEKELTVAKMRQFRGWKRSYQQWEFFTALGNRQLSRALILGQALLMAHTTLLALLYPLSAFYQEMLFLKLGTGTSGPQNGYIPLSPSIRKNLPQFASRYTRGEVHTALRILSRIDERIKTSQLDDEAALTHFLFSVLGSRD